MTTERKAPPTAEPGQNPVPEPPAVAALGGANPFVGLTKAQVVSAVGRWARHLLQNPMVMAARTAEIVAEDLRILAGRSDVAPDPKDRRFSDPAWANPVWHRVEQGYLSRRSTLLRTVDELNLDAKSAARARFGLMQIAEALSPTNAMATNPVALKKLAATNGRSAVAGLRHLSWDVRHNKGLPSQVDTRPFTMGGNIAVTPGAVVRREPQFELIQYSPATPTVHRRPVVVVSPQINKYYFLDIAPGRSFVEHAVAQGFQVFMMSWASAAPANRDWSADTYTTAVQQAVQTACEITGSPDALGVGFCAGGMTLAMLASHLAAKGDPMLAGTTLAVSMMDTQAKGQLNAFLTDRSAQVAVGRARRKGVLEGAELAKVFAWVRPNDLVWNYWVANYLLGETPPAFDVLAWNSDPTDLPAALYEDFVRIMIDNALVTPGAVSVLGTPVDLSSVKSDLYLVGAANDHLVPWQSVYGASQVHGGAVRFALSDSGHIQALINPPGNPKSGYYVGDHHPASSEEWVQAAERKSGSWWTDWAAWAADRAGAQVAAPTSLGSGSFPVLCAAPGTYVFGGCRPLQRPDGAAADVGPATTAGAPPPAVDGSTDPTGPAPRRPRPPAGGSPRRPSIATNGRSRNGTHREPTSTPPAR